MRLRPTFTGFCLLLAIGAGAVPVAALGQATTGGAAPPSTPTGGTVADGVVVPDATTPDATLPSTPATDDAAPINPAVTDVPQTTTPVPAAGTVTPTPPAYLTPGQYANVQPVSGVANLAEPDVPLEPVRLAALIAALIAALGIGLAVALRSLGLRTAVITPVQVAPGGRFTRVRERVGGLSDDVRDFLRHNR
jgi:hypothetical protein